MKWHKNLYEAVGTLYERVTASGKPPEEFLPRLFKNNPKWGKRDRDFIKHHLFTLLRYKNLWERLAGEIKDPPSWREVVDAYILATAPEMPPYLSYTKEQRQKLQNLYHNLKHEPHYRTGMPLWLFREGEKSWGRHWDEIASMLNKENKPVIRVNTLKTSRKKLADRLRAHHYLFSLPEDYPDAIVFEKAYRLRHTPWFKKGWFEWQDLSSQEAGYFSGAKPGMTVVDACAGAGGKTLHLAALMHNTGEIYAFDISALKLEELKKRAGRAGVKNLKNVAVITPEHIKKLQRKADILLVDAPCSGSGTYRRKPHLKWKFSPEEYDKIVENQRNILDEYAGMVKPGGHLVYITCSVLSRENEQQIKDFLNRNKDFTFVEEKHILPSGEHDGFYMAKLKRK